MIPGASPVPEIRVLSIVPYPFLPPRMGGQKGIALFNRFLSRHLTLHAAVTCDNIAEAEDTYPLFPVLGRSRMRYINPLLFFRIRRIIRQRSITHVMLEHPYLGWLGLWLKWFCSVQLVVHSHNIESHRFRSTGAWWWRILWSYERFIHRKADLSFFVTEEDRQYAITRMEVQAERCHTITYGFDLSSPPTAAEKLVSRSELLRRHGIPDNHVLLLFNGTLDYAPNRKAMDTLLHDLVPHLISSGMDFTLLICGKNLPPEYNQLHDYAEQHVLYAGFVEDIATYFKGSDIFLNPVTDGGGIKTKLVEALGYNLACVSSREGAIGVPASIAPNKLFLAESSRPDAWTETIRLASENKAHTIGPAFFRHFYWDEIARKAAAAIQQSTRR